jgi:hypothetical protein
MKNAYFSRVVAACGAVWLLAITSVPQRGVAQIPDPFLGPEPPVRIVSPANHTVFFTPVDIPLFAYTRSETRFTNVEFYANGTIDLGHATSLSTTNRIYQPFASPLVMQPYVLNRLGQLWCLVWSNAPAGNYSLTAVARGPYTFYPAGTSISRTSAPVNITILTPTNTVNQTDVVSIVASDPIAIAGTNMFWVWAGMTNATPSWTNWPPPRWGYFTNWGPKAAVFAVRRYGDATSAVTVNYKIGGTASNGVDYVALPGDVTIPAGSAYALIPIVPVDNGSNHVAKSVILTLQPSTNNPPDYLVGIPPCAEALILFNWPRPLPLALADGGFHVNASGPDGAWFAVQSSPDLVNWSTVGTNQVFQGSVDFIDPNPSGPSGYYRVQPLTSAPSQ